MRFTMIYGATFSPPFVFLHQMINRFKYDDDDDGDDDDDYDDDYDDDDDDEIGVLVSEQ